MFDWLNPDYYAEFRRRAELLEWMQKNPDGIPNLRLFYKDNPAQFICDFGCTVDPKNIEVGLPPLIPFVLYPRQVEWVEKLVEKWRAREPLLTEKTRQTGLSWLAMATSCTLCLFYEGMSIGFGSRKEEYVDRLGDPKSLFYKGRLFMEHLPREFTGGWSALRDAPHMRINFPGSGSVITGEAGDNIGRGNTTSIYMVDESAFLERPGLVDAALSQTTNCRVDISTPNGTANSFAQRRFSGKIEVFTLHWRDDPRKDEAWYAKQQRELDPVTLAQEVDIDYSASVEGVLIPSAWVQAAVDADIKLGFAPTGEQFGALDVADQGADKNAFCGAHGIRINVLEEWSGEGSDIFKTVQWAMFLCDEHGYKKLSYDGDGLGAGVRGDARVVNESREVGQRIDVVAHRGSAAVLDPEQEDTKGRKNKDFFYNRKAQAWWSVRTRFQQTYRAVVEGMDVDLDDIISIPSRLPLARKLCMELSQPTYSLNNAGKLLVDKQPEGTASPNLADAVVIRMARGGRSLRVSDGALKASQRAPVHVAGRPSSGGMFGISSSALERSRQRS